MVLNKCKHNIQDIIKELEKGMNMGKFSTFYLKNNIIGCDEEYVANVMPE